MHDSPHFTDMALYYSSIVEDRNVYYRYIFGMIKLVDDNVGKLLNFLNRKGVDKNTIIVFTSDHGM